MSYRLMPVENTHTDIAQIARVLVTASYEDAYFRTLYSLSLLPLFTEKASLNIGRKLLSATGWFMKIVLTEEKDGDDGHTHACASERSGDGEGEGEPKRGVSQTEHNNGTGTGEIVSYARWKLPSDVKEKLEKEYPEYSRVNLSLKDLMEPNAERRVGYGAKGESIRLNKQMREEVEQTLERAKTALSSHRPHMFLNLLATLPSHQRRGLATAHVKWGIKLADQEGLPIFLKSTPAGKGLYEKLGFKAVSSATHDLRKWGGEGLYTHVFMLREPEVVQG